MTAPRALLGALLVGAAVVLQSTVVGRLPLPGSPPDLVLVVVLAVALAEGAHAGMVTGFLAGSLADLVSDHALGRLALAYVVAAYLAGRTVRAGPRSVLHPFLAVALASAAALLLYAAEGLLLGDARVSGAALLRGLTSSLPYGVALVPFVVPTVALLLGRLDPDRDRRAARGALR